MSDDTIKVTKVDPKSTPERTSEWPVIIPRVDIIEREDALYLVADMPGADEETIDINVEKNLLTITGKMSKQEFEGYQQVLDEFDSGDYQRCFSLSNEVDQSGIEATMKDGVLRLFLPKAKEAVPRKIKIKTG